MVFFVFAIQLAATSIMSGSAWFIWAVHYRAFSHIHPQKFAEIEALHIRYTSYFVFPLMIAEAVSAVFLIWIFWATAFAGWTFLNMGLLLIIWIATFGYCFPMHRRLSEGFDEEAHRKLLAAHTLRTVIWALRVLLLLVMSFHMCSRGF